MFVNLEEFATPSSSVLNLVSELDESEETLLCHLGPGCPAYPLAPWIRKTAGFLGVTLYFMVLYTVQLVADCSPLLPPQSLENSPFLFGSLAQQYEEALYRAAEDTAYKFVAWRG